MNVLSLQDARVKDAALAALKRGKVIIVPTDTVYGFVCDASHSETISTIYRIKKRDAEKMLSLFVNDRAMLERYVEADSVLLDKLFESAWPGALIGIFRSQGSCGSVGVRVPAHSFLAELIGFFGRSLAQTSANISGEEPITKIADILRTFGGDERIALIVDAGDLPASMASTVVDFTKSPPEVLRMGAVDPKIFL